MSSTIKIPAMPEPMAYWFRNIDLDGEVINAWRLVEPRNPHMNTVADSVKELLAYRYQGKPCYEVMAVHTADQLAARDAQWQEMVGPILKELKDAATSLETIGRLAGFAEYVGDDGERVPTYMGHPDQIRGYAASRAAVARSALSAITE